MNKKYRCKFYEKPKMRFIGFCFDDIITSSVCPGDEECPKFGLLELNDNNDIYDIYNFENDPYKIN